MAPNVTGRAQAGLEDPEIVLRPGLCWLLKSHNQRQAFSPGDSERPCWDSEGGALKCLTAEEA